jgi:hypothetical protein
MNTSINMVATGGMIGMRRRLGTMTIHCDDASGRFFVTDDRRDGRLVSAGWASPEAAERAHKAKDDSRLIPA